MFTKPNAQHVVYCYAGGTACPDLSGCCNQQ